jgi:uncharacterized protein (UPF0261 family)
MRSACTRTSRLPGSPGRTAIWLMSVSLLAYAPLRQRHQNASVIGASGGKVTEMSLIVFRLLPALTQE